MRGACCELPCEEFLLCFCDIFFLELDFVRGDLPGGLKALDLSRCV